MVHDNTFGDDNGIFDTDDIILPGKTEDYYSRYIELKEGQYQAAPMVTWGLNSFNQVKPQKDQHLRIGSTVIMNKGCFLIKAYTWGGGPEQKLDRARVTWVERKENTKDTQSGVWEPEATDFSDSAGGRVEFGHAFEEPPTIVLWFNSIDLHWAEYFRLLVYAGDVTEKGFFCNLKNWPGDRVQKVQVSWIAIKKGKRNIEAGRFFDNPRLEMPQDDKTHEVKFPSGKFQKPPTVLTGLSMFDLPSWDRVKVASIVSDVTKDGFTWRLDHTSWAAANFEYIAIGN